MINTIVVGVDGSPGSARALHWAISRADEPDAEIVAVYGLRPLAEFVLDIPPFDPQELDRLRYALDHQWTAPLAEAGSRYRTELVEAEPVDAVLDAADRHDDTIVLGAQGHGGFVDRLLGGVTYKVAHRARQPVVIVPGDTA